MGKFVVSRKGFIPIILIVVLALVIAVGGVGIGFAWKTEYLDKWLPANIKEMFGRGEKSEEETEEDLTKDWKTYTNTEYGYQLKVPKDFLNDTEPENFPPLDFPSEWVGSSDGDWILLGLVKGGGEQDWCISIETYSPSGMHGTYDSTELANWVKGPVEGSWWYENTPDKPNFEIGGIPAVKVHFPEWPEADRIFFVKGNTFTIGGTEEGGELFEIQVRTDDESDKELFYLILSTFKFIK